MLMPGFMEDLLVRIIEDLIGRVSGPMRFRLLLQPLIAAVLGIRSGLKDAREGRPAYFWAVFTQAEQRREMLHDGWKSAGKVFIIANIIDAVYQLLILRWFYPGEAILVSAFLAFIPYLLIRGPVNRIARFITTT
ncbi:hypothetical protein ANRL1_04169 [Anaerolineae bacterium]|nr:hypothetical protein ANRL1_04169 [Anaerolineae bacterium]